MIEHSKNSETSAETMSRCVKYFKERLDQETKQTLIGNIMQIKEIMIK